MTEREQRLRKLIREYRQSRGLTQSEVAAAIGISRMSYHRIEAEIGPIRHFAKICRAIGCDTEALLREAGYTSHAKE